ncbi:ARM repeat-containing protein [Coprinellus micaceus]|uniref:ARM repeat-containing protein n=1 Tax=Coprinellus micaceus TaxID=71717 RepID=A0A4Y7TV58_COPMI|nr:ARM repeat-containing protein [Coprinellus micaceus]
MDTTFASSGALSRAHYAIVRQVEEASSVQEADQALAFEVKRVHERLARAAPTISKCKECLVILLYISSVALPGFLVPGSFEFAFPHALNLAEVGRTIEEKRIGYLFCAELMSTDHELRLMMVNTLRKDLESGSPGRMCLALDNLIAFANEDIVPAVQDVILDLISHNYPHIRRRAILALRSLAQFEPTLLSQGSETIVKRLQDRSESVAVSALAATAALPTSDPNFASARLVVNGLFSSIGISSSSALSLRILQCLQGVGLSETHVPFALDLIRSSACSTSSYKPASLLGLFRLLSQHTPPKLIEAEKAQEMSAVKCLTHLLQSQDPNDHYLYLACLLCVDPAVWAGTQEGRLLVLEAWEVERVMGFLESDDDYIRKMTLTLLARIDPAILSTYLTHILSSLPASSSSQSPATPMDLATLNVLAVKLFDIIELLTTEEGDRYAQGVKEVLGRLDEAQGTPGKKKVLQGAVEKVLVHVRESMSDFRISCATTLLTYITESLQSAAGPTPENVPPSFGPTFLVIAAALAVEYVNSVAVSPKETVKALCRSLKGSSPIVQDALLISILRLAAEIHLEDGASLPDEVKGTVQEVQDKAGTFIRKRCAQVLKYLSDDKRLRSVVRGLSSTTLPEFVQALEIQETKGRTNSDIYRDDTPSDRNSSANARSRSGSPNVGLASADARNASPSKSVNASSKLRYAAYEPPKPIASLRFGSSGGQRPSSPQLNKVNAISRSSSNRPSSPRSDAGSSSYGTGRSEYESTAVEAASLGLAAVSLGRLDSMDSLDSRRYSVGQGQKDRRLKRASSGTELVPGPGLPKSDLISLDSPFVTDATIGASGGSEGGEDNISSDEFEKIWNELPEGERGSQRGWCDGSVGEIARRLQGLGNGHDDEDMRVRVAPVDVPPFVGELKVMVIAGDGRVVAVRLKAGEEDSCLWRLKSDGLGKASAVRAALV